MEAEDIIDRAKVVWETVAESNMYNVRLEELRQDPDDLTWHVTFGGDVVLEHPPELREAPANQQIARIYRTLVLDIHRAPFRARGGMPPLALLQ